MKKKVLFFIESLGGGGAERVLDVIVRHLRQDLFDVTVLVVNGGGVYEKSVASKVNYKCVFKGNAYKNVFLRVLYAIKYKLIYNWLPVWLVYKWIVPKGFDVEIAFVEGFATKLLSTSTNNRSKKIAWVHTDLKQRPWTLDKGVFGSLMEEKKAYDKFDKIVCVSKDVENVMRSTYDLSSVCTIYNPVDASAIMQKGKEPSSLAIDNDKYNIVSVGRLVYEKGFDTLLNIFHNVKKVESQIHLWIVGVGGEYESLKRQVDNLSLNENVTFTGFMKNPYALMSKMDLFVCSSRVEGFSLAIAESLILRVPVISMKCSGPCELIQDGKNGSLCDSYDMLECKMKDAIRGSFVPANVPDFINIDETMKQIVHLLKS